MNNMKLLILILILTLNSCSGCREHYRHELTYSVVLMYENGDKDTMSGKIVQPDSEVSKCHLYLELGRSGCVTVKNGLFNYQRLACSVRNFKILEETIETIKQ